MLEQNLPINIYEYSRSTRFAIRYLAVFVGFTIIAVIGFIPIAVLWSLANPTETIEILSVVSVVMDKEMILPYLAVLLVPTIKWHLEDERRESI